MDTSKDGIKAWLSSHPDRDRNWLAEQCGVSKNTVNNWLSTSIDLPSKALLIIESLMKADAESLRPDETLDIVDVPVRVSAEQFDSYTRAFKVSSAETLREWMIKALDAAAADDPIMKSATSVDVSNITPISAVAEDPAEYKFTPRPHIQAAAGSPISAEVMDWDGAEDTVLVRIVGLSMVPLLNDGDVVPMRHKRVSRNPFMKKGLIYLVEYDGGYTVKRYNTRNPKPEEKGEEWVENGKVKVLESINPAFSEIIIKQPLEWVAWLDDKSKD